LVAPLDINFKYKFKYLVYFIVTVPIILLNIFGILLTLTNK
jgi:hypothetical protein